MCCPYCGTKTICGTNYCNNCGGKLSNDGLPLDVTLARLYNEWGSFYYRYKKTSKQMKGNYQAAYNHLSKIKNRPFCRLRTKDYQAVIDSVSYLSTSSLEKIKQLVMHLSNYAIMEDIIKTNYAQFIDVPISDKSDINIFSDSDILTLYEYSKNRDNKYFKTAEITLVLIFTGFRPTELFSIKSFSVSLEEKVIIGGIKTSAGKNRLVPISDIIFPIIKKWVSGTADDDYIVLSPMGKQLRLEKWRKRDFYPLMEKLGFNSPDDEEPHYKPYSARHTFATLGEEAGMKPRVLSKICGHTNTSFTNNIYIHARAKAYRSEIEKINYLFPDIIKECVS